MPNHASADLIGHLGRDWEIKYLPSGMAIAANSIAVSRKQGGEKKTSWFNLKAFDKTAAMLAENTKKGDAHLFLCEPQEETWEKDGKRQSKIVFVVQRVVFLVGGERAKPECGSPSEDLAF